MSERYPGNELELFAQACNWKSYVASVLRPWLGPRVLEVGAGIGTNVPLMFAAPVQEWTALEPDASLAARIKGASRVMTGTVSDINRLERFDTILYLDVLEHIADDQREIERAWPHVATGGRLIVLAPAHQFLYTPFDAAIGHCRRYSRTALCALAPDDASLVELRMLDCAGLLASLGNRLVLRNAHPTPAQIATWDNILVPLSRYLDPLARFRFGKSVLAIWTRL